MTDMQPFDQCAPKRRMFLGIIAWLSVSLIAAGMFPASQLNGLWMTSGLSGLASAVGLMEVVKRDGERTREVLMQYVAESRNDALTGLANRRELDARLEDRFRLALERKLPLCALMIDIDHFKRLNDTYGHQAGDRVLQKTGHTLASCVRADDIVARYGGEEFAVIADGVNLRTGRMLAERIRLAVQDQEFADIAPSLQITVSIGLSTVEPDDTPENLLHRADIALYQAKNASRNCTFCYADGSYMRVVNLCEGMERLVQSVPEITDSQANRTEHFDAIVNHPKMT